MHSLICGVTECGKTTLAHAIARALDEEGQPVIVYDPVGTPTAVGAWPERAVVFQDEDELFGYLSRDDVGPAHVFIDEAGDVFPLTKKHNLWLLTRGRHFGFSVVLIAQRPKLIAPSARTQCARGYAFRLCMDDTREIAADFGHSNLHKIQLDKGDFFILQSGEPSIKRANVFSLIADKRGTLRKVTK